MSSDEVDVATRFLAALTSAAATGEREPVVPFLAPDVEWVTQKRTLKGIDDLREHLTWGHPADKLDVEFEQREVQDLGEGRIVANLHETYRVKETGDFAYACDRRIDVTIRDGKVVRYEMRVVG